MGEGQGRRGGKGDWDLPPMSTGHFHDKGKVDWGAAQQGKYKHQHPGAVTFLMGQSFYKQHQQ